MLRVLNGVETLKLNGRLRQRNDAKAYMNNANETKVEYYQEFVKGRKILPHET